ncbi:uncharacterized protein LOC111027115 [Myzus persicae]|uniref:uncharacterized protein LOC111027115 n=1 Tax=Myzus persicae TaxID=13164 RepID=UPI000B933B16|nr:uncharacterized protein LOC111027115 [Myzus persicae]
MICYMCQANIHSWKALVSHFKIFHFLKSDSTYKCAEKNCTQTFQCLGSFKRHMTIKHTSYEIEPLPNNPSLFAESSCKYYSMVEEKFNIDTAINSFYKSAVEFIVGLHDNNNFTKKDVSNIQSGIIQSLLTPMVSILKNVVKSEVKEPLSLSKFDNILTAMSNPFQFCTSEYILLKWLVANDLISEVKQFTIHNEIRPVQHLGETVYDEKQTKGALLPLKLQFKKYFESKQMCEEDISCMRNIDNYNTDVAIQNFSESGIYKESILNQIQSFHVTQNFCVDTMHDLYEAKLLTLDTLNNRKSNFNYGPIEFGNISPEISINHLNNCHLKMSAREVMTFIYFFPLMVGDLVPRNDEIDIDYSAIFPHQNIYFEFEKKCDTIYDILPEKVKDSSCLKILDQIKNGNNLNENVKNSALMYLLHGMFAPTSKKVTKDDNGKKNLIKLSIKDSQESFMMFGESVEMMESHLENLKKQCKPIQPFILVVGTIFYIKEILVYFDSVKYKVHSIIRAIEVCYKIFQLFNLQYPPESLVVWLFIQKYFFNYSSTYNIPLPKLSQILTELN